MYNRVYHNLFTERGLPMNDFTKELTKTLMEKGDVNELFRHHLEKAINTLLKTELSAFLDYEKYERSGWNSGNSRNGNYSRSIKTQYGELDVTIPRDRNGEFANQTIEPYKRNNDKMESFVIHLYQNGMTTEDIASIIEKMYGHHYSPGTVSNMTMVMNEHIEAFHNRPLNDRYAVIYLDATHLPVRRETVQKEAVYIAIGITPEGHKEILAYDIHPTESAYNWKELLKNLKERGAKETLLFVTDGLKEIRENILEVYPKALHQTCWVHVARGVSHKVRVKHRSDVLEDLKGLYRADDEEGAQEAFKHFKDQWKTLYPKVIQSLEDNPSLFTFYAFPKAIQRSLYTTNLIEGFNKHFKRYTKRKEQFPTVDSLERFIVARSNQYNEKHSLHIHKGFNKVQRELEVLFETLYQ